MKKLLLLGISALTVAAVAGDDVVKGRVKTVVMHPDVVVTVDTGKGMKQVFLGTEKDFEGVKLWLDRSDRLSATGRMENGRLMAERIWVNGGYFKIPNPPMRDMDTDTQRVTIANLSWAPDMNRFHTHAWIDATRQ
jgi:hypothetical protein